MGLLSLSLSLSIYLSLSLSLSLSLYIYIYIYIIYFFILSILDFLADLLSTSISVDTILFVSSRDLPYFCTIDQNALNYRFINV